MQNDVNQVQEICDRLNETRGRVRYVGYKPWDNAHFMVLTRMGGVPQIRLGYSGGRPHNIINAVGFGYKVHIDFEKPTAFPVQYGESDHLDFLNLEGRLYEDESILEVRATAIDPKTNQQVEVAVDKLPFRFYEGDKIQRVRENTDYQIILPNRSDEDKYPTANREFIINEREVYRTLKADPSDKAEIKRQIFKQPNGSEIEGIVYPSNSRNCTEVILFWAPGRDEWIAVTYYEFFEGYEAGRSLYLDEYDGPFVLNDSACKKLLEAYRVDSSKISIEDVRKINPSNLEEVANK